MLHRLKGDGRPCLSLSSFLLISSSLSSSLSIFPSLSHFSPSHIFPPSILPLFFSSWYKHSLSILRGIALLIPLSSSPSLFFPFFFLTLPLFFHPSLLPWGDGISKCPIKPGILSSIKLLDNREVFHRSSFYFFTNYLINPAST